jgi:DNA-binding response OmpR family regulator
MPSVLVVDDEPQIATIARDYLTRAGFSVAVAADGATGLELTRRTQPDLVVLDLGLPRLDGFEVARALRRESDVPIIMLTARVDETDRLHGFEVGADDYITKPFSPRELLARIKAVLRRCERPLTPASITAGDLEIDTAAMTVTVRGDVVTTTATEFRLLHYLAEHAGRVFTRDQILDAVWKETTFVSPRSVDVYVRKLREKIENDPEQPRYLKTVRGTGYRFEVPR